MNGATIAGGLIADSLFGEPPSRWHLVVWFATAVQRAEGKLYADDRAAGATLALFGIGLAAGTGVVLDRLIGRRAAVTVAVGVCTAGRMLDREAQALAELLDDGDLTAARARICSLVGRDASELDEGELARAAIESVAENCVDAVTASLWWAAIAGAPGVLAHRASNTLDAMVGHRSPRYERFGWASARLDDIANYLPARLTALAVAIARPRSVTDIWRAVRHDSGRHPSPNGGVVEAAFAAALGVRLGGVNRYAGTTENRGILGQGRSPHTEDIGRAIALRRHSTVVSLVLILGVERMRRGRGERHRIGSE